MPRDIVTDMGIEKIEEIIEEVEDGAVVHIYRFERAPDFSTNEINDIVDQRDNSKAVGYYIRNGEAKKSGSEYKSTKKKICSVAKGSSKTLSSKVSLSLSLILSGDYYDSTVKSDFASSVTFHSKTYYSGISPEIKAPNNSRTFYLQSYRQNYTRTQTQVNAKTNEIMGTKKATIKKGSSSAEYSVDVKI